MFSEQTYEDPAIAPRMARPLVSAPLSMDIPVALPEMGQDFVVEASMPHMRSLKRKNSDSDGDLSVVPFEPVDDVVPLASDSL